MAAAVRRSSPLSRDTSDTEYWVADLHFQLSALRDEVADGPLTPAETDAIRDLLRGPVVGLARAIGMTARPRPPVDPTNLVLGAVRVSERWEGRGWMDGQWPRLWRAALMLLGYVSRRVTRDTTSFITPETAIRNMAASLDVQIEITRRAPRPDPVAEIQDLGAELQMTLIGLPEKRRAVMEALDEHVLEPVAEELRGWAGRQ